MGELRVQAIGLRDWVLDCALPIWWDIARHPVHGGFYEAIDLDGRPVSKPIRARTIARQIFCYCEAGRLGWKGLWEDAALQGLNFFVHHFIARDGTVVSSVDVNGRCCDARFELYNQAFALLAYASAHRTFGAVAGWHARAAALRAALEQQFANPLGGFCDGAHAGLRHCANPHMHLFEAALEWSDLDDDSAWSRMADGLARLCLDKMIDRRSGAVCEFFTEDWNPVAGVAGSICEPGHNYEWAVLLDHWARHVGKEQPQEVARMIGFSDAHGVNRPGFVVNTVLTDGSVHDPVARLWAQAERIRAYLVQGRDVQQLSRAIGVLWRFLETPTAGLWFDQFAETGVFVNEPARATSLYHIIGAVNDLLDLCPEPALMDDAAHAQPSAPRLLDP